MADPGVAGRRGLQRLSLGGEPARRDYAAGEAFSFTAADIHRVQHAGDAPAVSLHAYSPPLWRMGAYEVAADGRREPGRSAIRWRGGLRR